MSTNGNHKEEKMTKREIYECEEFAGLSQEQIEKRFNVIQSIFKAAGQEVYWEHVNWYLLPDQFEYFCKEFYHIDKSDYCENFDAYKSLALKAREVYKKVTFLSELRLLDPFCLMAYGMIALGPLMEIIDVNAFVGALFDSECFGKQWSEMSAEVRKQTNAIPDDLQYDVPAEMFRKWDNGGRTPLKIEDLEHSRMNTMTSLYLFAQNNLHSFVREIRQGFGEEGGMKNEC